MTSSTARGNWSTVATPAGDGTSRHSPWRTRTTGTTCALAAAAGVDAPMSVVPHSNAQESENVLRVRPPDHAHASSL